MSRDTVWKKFEKTGSVFDYLEYACTCEDDRSVTATDSVSDEYAANDAEKELDE